MFHILNISGRIVWRIWKLKQRLVEIDKGYFDKLQNPKNREDGESYFNRPYLHSYSNATSPTNILDWKISNRYI